MYHNYNREPSYRHLNSYIHAILTLLKQHDRPLSFSEIKQSLNIDLTQNRQLFDILHKNPKITFTNDTLLFQPLYNIRSAEDLEKIMKESEGGLLLNDLLDSPVDVQPFIAELQKENKIFVLKDTDNSQIVFFNGTIQNTAAPQIKSLFHTISVPNYQDLIKELNTAGIKSGIQEEKKRYVVVQKSKVKKYKRKIKITNTHIKDLNLDLS
ncbi:transcription factor TFIIE beta subunit, TFIIEB, Tfa2 [Hamiltosporidium tvaerminnensis]|nr:transcription factor TFIIE beta subunit, TFIIEB, Tfa2 [Hamiltosporidium tvaerminnensis]KAK1349048.1 transcription factor TFIIE beta subunit, TFIIEB, Tfa2 [Hamiltosporidium tvaerminnensis]